MKPMVSDEVLRVAVVNELEGDPEVDAKHIAVRAIDGAVMLGGHVMTVHEKHVAVRAAERVPAVRAVADDIEVRSASSQSRADDEVAEEIARLRGRPGDGHDSVGVQVRDGRVILHGEVESTFERDVIEREARQLSGVRAVDNLIEVKPQAVATAADVERRVQAAIAGVPDLEAGSIRVAVDNGTVYLYGHVPSVATLQTILQAAQTAPGVTAVESEIGVRIQEDGPS
jgi:osmotically-inducible protein OsmY